MISTALAGCTNNGTVPQDGDGDGMSDAQETASRAITVTTATGTITKQVTSDPHKADTDGDGLNDGQEFAMGTDPGNADTDGDRLLDGSDVTLVADSPLAIAWRQAQGILESPRGTFLGERGLCADIGGLKPLEWSSDRPVADALGDGEELIGWNVTAQNATRHVTSDPCQPDEDRDGLTDDREKELATDPRDADTDGDGAPDAIDVDPLHNVGLSFVLAQGSNAPDDILTIILGASEESHRLDENSTIHIDVDDRSASRTTDEATIIFRVTNATGAPRKVLHGEDDKLLALVDLAKSTLAFDGTDHAPGALELHGADGALVLTWSVTRS